MARYRAFLWTLAGFVLISLACNAFAGNVEPELPPPPTAVGLPPAPTLDGEESTPGGGEAAATATLPSAETPAAAGTAGAATLQALVDLNVRSGPGVNYPTDGFLSAGDTAVLIGRDPDSGWWKILCPAQATGADCWVSGRAQYAVVTGADGVPVAAVPPTPTPQPQSVGTVIAYVENGRLFALPLDLGQGAPQPGTLRALGTRTDVQAVWLSPDGLRAAYVAGSGGENGLYVANVDGSDDRLLVSSPDLQEPAVDVQTANAEPAAGLVGSVAWAADGRQLLFNTAVRSQEMSIVGVNTDLWRVTLDGDVENLLPVGEGGATLAVSGAGQVLLGQSGALRRARADGSASATVLNFPQVNTASEWLYYPEPQWTQGGSQAFVAIPGPEPFAAETSATLWLVLPEGPAVQLGTLPGSVLFQPVRWSPDGRRLAYVRAGGGEAALVLGNGDGRETAVYDNAADLATFAWSPNSARFLYAGPGFYAIGQPGEAPLRVQIPAELRVTDMVWLNDERFLTALGSPTSGAWSLYSTDLAGNAAPLHSVAGRELVWDVWAP